MSEQAVHVKEDESLHFFMLALWQLSNVIIFFCIVLVLSRWY